MTEQEINNKNIIGQEETIEEKEFIDEVGDKIKERIIIKIIYVKDSRYKERLKESQKKYYENNKSKVTNYIKEYSNERYKNDEEYRERIKEQRRQDYAKKKELKVGK
jgi:hypothetical protein